MERLTQFQEVDQLIRREATGNRHQLARKLKVSPATVSRIISDMKQLGAPIAYSSALKSYIYTTQVELRLGFYPPPIVLQASFVNIF